MAVVGEIERRMTDKLKRQLAHILDSGDEAQAERVAKDILQQTVGALSSDAQGSS
jgi:hypothetical protein